MWVIRLCPDADLPCYCLSGAINFPCTARINPQAFNKMESVKCIVLYFLPCGVLVHLSHLVVRAGMRAYWGSTTPPAITSFDRGVGSARDSDLDSFSKDITTHLYWVYICWPAWGSCWSTVMVFRVFVFYLFERGVIYIRLNMYLCPHQCLISSKTRQR